VLEKFDYYDAVAHIIPGTIVCLFGLYVLDIAGISLPKISDGSLAEVGIGVAVAYTAGHLLQGISSSLEPLYYALWGGKPSVKLLERSSGYFSDAQRRELIAAMVSYFGVSEECPDDNAGKELYYQRLFERGMALCNRQKLGRVENFVASYAFHRAMMTSFLVSFLAAGGIKILFLFHRFQVPAEKLAVLHLLLVAAGAGLVLEFFRARKRAYYYAREVISMVSDYLRASTANASAGE